MYSTAQASLNDTSLLASVVLSKELTTSTMCFSSAEMPVLLTCQLVRSPQDWGNFETAMNG